MADLSKLIKKQPVRRAELGAPPTLDEASENLAAPEVAPATKRARGAAVAPTRSKPPTASGRIDGRSARKTHRTVQFATRVTPEWDERIRAMAQREGLLLVELLEKLLDHYDQNGKKR